MSAVSQHVEQLFEALSARSTPSMYSQCGSALMHLDTVLFSLDSERTWTVPLPFCPKCDLEDGLA